MLEPRYAHAHDRYQTLSHNGLVADSKDESFFLGLLESLWACCCRCRLITKRRQQQPTLSFERSWARKRTLLTLLAACGPVTIALSLLAADALANPDDPETAAVRAMQACGITDAARLLELADPAAIVRACRRWNARRAAGENVGRGLLVSWIRDGGLTAADEQATKQDKVAALHRRFDDLTGSFPTGAVTETHERMRARQWPHDEQRCAGRLVVTEAEYPNLTAECGECGFVASYSLRALAGLRKPADLNDGIGLADGAGKSLLNPADPGPSITVDAGRVGEAQAVDEAGRRRRFRDLKRKLGWPEPSEPVVPAEPMPAWMAALPQSKAHGPTPKRLNFASVLAGRDEEEF